MQRDYEALVIVKATGTEAEIARAASQVEEPIKKLGGTIVGSKALGRRRLAYRIAKQQEGHYQLLEFRLPASQVDELKRLLRLNDVVIRFLLLNRSDQPPAPRAPAPRAEAAAASA